MSKGSKLSGTALRCGDSEQMWISHNYQAESPTVSTDNVSIGAQVKFLIYTIDLRQPA